MGAANSNDLTMMFLQLLFSAGLALAVSATRSHVVEFSLHKAEKMNNLIKIPEFSGKFVNTKLENFQYYYQITLDIGTPPQKIDFTIDTGSSDLWVMAASNPFCTTDPRNMTGINCTGSIFDYTNSSTFHDLEQPFNIAYGDRTFSNGSLVSDTVRLGKNVVLANATFGLAKQGNSSTCVFGIGFIGDEGEARVHRNKTGVYPTYFNIPTLMKQQGSIITNAYSLWLNDAGASAGSILFGGIDRTKYYGPLTVMPVYNNYYEYTDHPIQTRVMLNSVKANDDFLAEFNIAVLLDSGTSFSYLPQTLLDAFGNSLGFLYDDSIGYYFGSRSTALENVKEFRLNFSGAEIRVPTSDLLVDLTRDDGSPFLIDGKFISILAMSVAEDSYSNILGDVFLRSMYAVFDLDHYQIALAQSHKNSTDTPDISVIEASIPGATQAAGYANTIANNSAFDIYPFTPAIPAPSVISIDFNITMNKSTLQPTISPASIVTATATGTSDSLKTVTTTVSIVSTTTATPSLSATTTTTTTTTTEIDTIANTDNIWRTSSTDCDSPNEPYVTLYWDNRRPIVG